MYNAKKVYSPSLFPSLFFSLPLSLSLNLETPWSECDAKMSRLYIIQKDELYLIFYCGGSFHFSLWSEPNISLSLTKFFRFCSYLDRKYSRTQLYQKTSLGPAFLCTEITNLTKKSVRYNQVFVNNRVRYNRISLYYINYKWALVK